MVALPESAASGSISRTFLSRTSQRQIIETLTTTSTISNHNGSSKDSPKEVNKKE